ncbi:MAG: protein kinase [Acidobacteriota bacterium]|nr:MAG: protein kinase [Acidobacteriota bacterium]
MAGSDDKKRWERLKAVFNEVVDLPDDERAAALSRLRIDQQTIYEELSDLLAVDNAAAGFLDEPNAPDNGHSIIGETIGNYRVTRELGRGGMGAVFEAEREDGDFDKRVAIKLTGHNVFSEELARRFRNEKQILAKLEHPNIVRLFDGGITADRIPYYVMEYVEGTPITAYCREKALTTRERLRLFVQVLDAVSYAHRRLVVHRDLKPSNILVTDDGTVKLLDFGIAKALDIEGGTQTSAPMTPEYAAPEQIARAPVSTATDIYSLGILLFEMLTGLPPTAVYRAKGLDVYRAVIETEPSTPSAAVTRSEREGSDKDFAHIDRIRLANELRGDLDNIVLKCLGKEPETRYASADQLLADIEAYLAGRPVSVHPQSRSYRFKKFVGRNRLPVAAASAAVLLILSGLGMALYQWSVARHNQLIAEQRFEQVRKVANSLIFDYHDEIAKLEGSTALRERLVTDAVAYLDAISQGEITDPELLKELGIAYRKIGEVQGASYLQNLGKLDSAIVNYQRASELQQKLLSMSPDDIVLKRELAETLHLLGNGYARSGNGDKGLESINAGIDLLEKDEDTLDIDGLLALSELRRQRPAYFTNNVRRYEEYLNSIELLKRIIAKHPDDRRLLDQMLRLQSFAGNSAKFAGYDFIDEGKPEQARLYFEAALKHYLDFASKVEQTVPHMDNKTLGIRRRYGAAIALGDIYIRLGQMAKGLVHISEAKEYNRQLRLDPSNREARMDLLRIAHTDQDYFIKTSKLREALSNIEEAISLAQELSELDRSNIELTYYLLHFHQKAGKVLTKLNQKKAIRAHMEKESHYRAILQEKVGHYFTGKAYF